MGDTRSESCSSSRKRSFARKWQDCSPHDHYELAHALGKGTYGTAYRAACKHTGADRAVKQVEVRGQLSKTLSRLDNELEVARRLDHPNIVKVYDTFSGPESISLVMELCTGGELFDKIVQQGGGGLKESLAASYSRQILSALCYLHHISIVHRDVKPENFLLTSPQDDATLKLIDFGLATYLDPKRKVLRSKVGTPLYVAPQVLQGSYDEKCDVWSAGIVTYIMLIGAPPFKGKSDAEVLQQVIRGQLYLEDETWSSLPMSAKALVTEMLTHEVRLRPSAKEALCNHWLEKVLAEVAATVATTGNATLPPAAIAAAAVRAATDAAGGCLEETPCQASPAKGALQRLARAAAARHLGESDVRPWQFAFQLLDRNGDGRISGDDLTACVEDQSLPGMETLSIEFTDFLAANIDSRLFARPEVCRAAFRTFDLNGDGTISADELMEVLGKVSDSIEGVDLDSVFEEVNADQEGGISFEQFMTVLVSNRDGKPDFHIDDDLVEEEGQEEDEEELTNEEGNEERSEGATSQQSFASSSGGSSSKEEHSRSGTFASTPRTSTSSKEWNSESDRASTLRTSGDDCGFTMVDSLGSQGTQDLITPIHEECRRSDDDDDADDDDDDEEDTFTEEDQAEEEEEQEEDRAAGSNKNTSDKQTEYTEAKVCDALAQTRGKVGKFRPDLRVAGATSTEKGRRLSAESCSTAPSAAEDYEAWWESLTASSSAAQVS